MKAYEQVADVLRGRVVAGELAPGARLPSETVLASDFGVGRATVREALRLLAAQNLSVPRRVRPAAASHGAERRQLSASLRSGLGLLAEASGRLARGAAGGETAARGPAARLAASPPQE